MGKIILTVIYSLMFLSSIFQTIKGGIFLPGIFIAAGIACCVSALNNKGGAVVKKVAFIFSGFAVISLVLGSIFNIYIKLAGGEAHAGLSVLLIIVALLPGFTIFYLKSDAKSINEPITTENT